LPVCVQGANADGRLSPASARVNPTKPGSREDSKTSMGIGVDYLVGARDAPPGRGVGRMIRFGNTSYRKQRGRGRTGATMISLRRARSFKLPASMAHVDRVLGTQTVFRGRQAALKAIVG
jgi:hypothetical protein